MSDSELLKRWKVLVAQEGYENALAAITDTKKVSASTADRLCAGRFKSAKPSRKTREAILEVLGKLAS